MTASYIDKYNMLKTIKFYSTERMGFILANKFCFQRVLHTLSVTLKNQPSPSAYSLCNSILERIKFQKYLDVYISSALSKAKQWEEVKKRASRIFGDLQPRNLSLCGETLKETPYIGLVCAMAEYAAAAWPLLASRQTRILLRCERSLTRRN